MSGDTEPMAVTVGRMYRPDLARVQPKTVNEEARTVEVVWTTGARVRRESFWSGEKYDEELSLDDEAVDLGRLNSGAPLLNAHNSYDLEAQIGVVERAWLQGPKGRREGRAVVKISERADVEPIWLDVKAGILRNISVGYAPKRMEKIERKNDVPLMRVVEWEPMELSIVPIPADAKAQIRAGTETYGCVITVQNGVSMDELATRAAESAAVTTNAADTPEVRALTEADVARAASEAVAADRARAAAIFAAAEKLGLERSVAQPLVDGGVPLDRARETLIDAAAEAGAATRIRPATGDLQVTRAEEKLRRTDAMAAMLHRYDPATYQLPEAAREYRGMELLEIAREALVGEGHKVRGWSRQKIAQHALAPVIRGGMLTTSDFSSLLADLANKTLRDAYQQSPRTFTAWARRTTAADFKSINRIQLGEAPKLEKVNEHGEYTRGAIGEAKETYRLAKWGRVLALTWETIVNDDLDAMTRIPALFGSAAANLESDIVYSILLANAAMADGTALFDNNHGNTGTGAIDVTNVGAGRAKMRLQKGLDGVTLLNIAPRYMLVPPAKETAAEQLFASLTPAQQSNAVPQSFRTITPIAEPRLESGVTVDGTTSAGSATQWYLAADPAQIDTVEYAYLEGEEGVQLDNRVGFDIDGLEIKARLVFAAKAIDWRGLFRSTGS